ncbi:hypothetical protein F4604DRAFT_1687924 [Suillus subluteus]|nr:hypothetical protein F4604DRAFT_1687924 [Suillus subluteus]
MAPTGTNRTIGTIDELEPAVLLARSKDGSRGRYDHRDDAAIHCTMVLGIFHSHDGKEAPLTMDEHIYTSHEVQVIHAGWVSRVLALTKVEGADAAGGRSHFVTVKKGVVSDLQGKDPKDGC